MAKMTILERVERVLARSPDNVFIRADFRKLGGYDQVGVALRQALKNGLLVRGGYGVYVKARKSSLTGNPVPVIPLEQMAREALAKLGVKADVGASAKAYRDGRTTQIPMATAFDVGKSRVNRKIGFGGKTVRYERTISPA